MDKFPEMGVFGQKELQPGVFFGAGQFKDSSGGRKGLAQVKISFLIGPGVDEQGGPGIGLKVGKFSEVRVVAKISSRLSAVAAKATRLACGCPWRCVANTVVSAISAKSYLWGDQVKALLPIFPGT